MRSIRGRLLVLAAVWLTAALLAAFLFLSALLEDFVTDRFDAEAGAIADALSASLEVSDGGRIEVDDPPADPRFRLPLTGWYWQAEADGRVFDRSDSLLDGWLTGPGGEFAGGAGRG